MSMTRYKDNKLNDVEEAIEIMLNPILDDENGLVVRKLGWKQWKVFDELQIAEIPEQNDEIEYSAIRFSYIKSTSEKDDVVNGMVIIYKLHEFIYYIIDKNSDAMPILRRLLKCTERNRIEKSGYAIGNDFILWLLYKVDTGRNQIYQNNDFVINAVAIKAFNGKSSDEQSKAKFSGEAIMNMNSSYAFILESNNLQQINLEIQATNHERIIIKLKNNVLDIQFDMYNGVYEAFSHNEIISLLYLFCYNYILPKLLYCYQNDINNNCWNNSERSNYKSIIKERLVNRITDMPV